MHNNTYCQRKNSFEDNFTNQNMHFPMTAIHQLSLIGFRYNRNAYEKINYKKENSNVRSTLNLLSSQE